MSVLRIGTRGSPLALKQAAMTSEAMVARGLPQPDILVIETQGDRVQDRRLAELGGKALWTRELDAALLDGRIDCAVHSMKDVETGLAGGIALAAVLARADPRDRLIGPPCLDALPPGARVGTSSPRRAAQLAFRRPDVETVLLRGNVHTRLQRVREGAVAATFLAAAGLERLGLDDGVPLSLDEWLPAAAQGIVGITARAGDRAAMAAIAPLCDRPTLARLTVERALLANLGGSCHTALAAHAVIRPSGDLALTAQLYSPDGRERVCGTEIGPAGSADAIGARLAARMLAEASPAIRASLGPW